MTRPFLRELALAMSAALLARPLYFIAALCVGAAAGEWLGTL